MICTKPSLFYLFPSFWARYIREYDNTSAKDKHCFSVLRGFSGLPREGRSINKFQIEVHNILISIRRPCSCIYCYMWGVFDRLLPRARVILKEATREEDKVWRLYFLLYYVL